MRHPLDNQCVKHVLISAIREYAIKFIGRGPEYLEKMISGEAIQIIFEQLPAPDRDAIRWRGHSRRALDQRSLSVFEKVESELFDDELQGRLRAQQRLGRFADLEFHPLRHMDYKKMNTKEVQYAIKFIIANSTKSTDDYILTLNRMQINDPNVREGSRTRIWGLLLEAATSEVFPRLRRK